MNVPQEYQWILALISPFFRDFFIKLTLEVAFKAAGDRSRSKKSVKFPVIHYISTRHAIFLSVIIGGVSTPATSACLIATDFAKTIYSGLKIINRRKKMDLDKPAMEGKSTLRIENL